MCTSHFNARKPSTGRANYLPMTKTTYWRGYTPRVLDQLHKVGAGLLRQEGNPQLYLAPGMPNPLRAAAPLSACSGDATAAGRPLKFFRRRPPPSCVQGERQAERGE